MNMKKIYMTPQIDVTFFEPIVMESATNAKGIIYDGDGKEFGRIDWGGGSDPGHDPNAKDGGNLWDDMDTWDD